MPAYKLTYFDGRGRAEVARLLFAVCEIEYEDERISFEDWGKLKGETPLGQLPILTTKDGCVYPNSVEIARYIASVASLDGKDSLERFQAGTVVGACADLNTALFKFMFEKDENRKGEAKKEVFEVTGPRTFAAFERWLESYGKGSGYFLKSGFSWADLYVFDSLEKWMHFVPTATKEFPKLDAHFQKIKAQPKVAEWLNGRPETEF